MFPSLLAHELRDVVTRYLGTTFALADADARRTLEQFLSDRDTGLFRGPFLRTRLPFRGADPDWRAALDWAPDGFRPYRHQSLAFDRLSSKHGTPRPTLVTTGTGSGKTESFLIPLLDHCARLRAEGQAGIKALILYPMNALANDQASRIARIVEHNRERLGGVTAGLFTGDSGENRSMSPTGIIENRETLRAYPPDILLTNYKMLDYMLLRQRDADLWAGAEESLTYLVLDEFHTYDGAQGTDVALLLRRLGMSLGVSRPGRPLGDIVPVATSATLGDGTRTDELLTFARTVFGQEFDADALIREDRLSADEWSADAASSGRIPLLDEVTGALASRDRHLDRLRAAAEVFAEEGHAPDVEQPVELGEFLRGHPLTAVLLAATTTPATVEQVLDRLADRVPSWAAAVQGGRVEEASAALAAFLGLVSRATTADGTPLLHVEVQLWLREITHILRALDDVPYFRWHDDGRHNDVPENLLPAVYCRHCGRAGWGAALRAGRSTELDGRSEQAWSLSVRGDTRFRAMLHAPVDAEASPETVQWLDPLNLQLQSTRPDLGPDSAPLPVLVTTDDGARDQTCPSCERKDGIRFIGSGVSTLASVVLGHLFGHKDVEAEQKKTLVFTDSVQDAAHRAGFVEARAYAFNLRSLLHRAVRDTGVRLDQVAANLVADAGAVERYALLPPALSDREDFRQFWASRRPSHAVRRKVEQRMSFAAHMEFGLNSRTGRTLELTGSVSVNTDVGSAAKLRRIANSVLKDHLPPALDRSAVRDADVLAWVRGVVERMRTRGAIDHVWLREYINRDGNRWPLWGGRRRNEGMPAFPSGRPAPAFPTTAARSESFDSVVAHRTWFTRWTRRCLGVPEPDAPRLVAALFETLRNDGVLLSFTTQENATVYALSPERIFLHRTEEDDLDHGRAMLTCVVCATKVPMSPEIVAQLVDAPCMRDRCAGTLRPSIEGKDYYRALYGKGDVRRIVAREHTSLLDRTRRTTVERAFKEGEEQNSPNVLTCTPTLELGIDIGDLSAVALTSLPRTTSAYLQRVGRAGRRSGNALVVAVLPGRAAELHHLTDPLRMIAGEITPPACYIDAIEILRRQYFASLVDRSARRGPSWRQPRRAVDLLRRGLDRGQWLRKLLDDARDNAEQYVAEFVATLDDLPGEATVRELSTWAGVGTPEDEVPALERAVAAAGERWQRELAELNERISAISAEREQLGDDDVLLTEEQRSDRRRLRGELRSAMTLRDHLHEQHWLDALITLGLLPNYTLLDDTTRLDVQLWWTDEETGEHHIEPETIERGSRTALVELAPGSTFYANRVALLVDAVDLGSPGNPSTVRWRCCPSCGWSGPDVDGTSTSACPRCQDQRVADGGQRLTVVPFRRVSAYAGRDEARFGDEHEDRVRQRFVVAVAADVDPVDVTARWELADFPFGVDVCRRITVRWFNLGPAERSGAERRIAGEDFPAPLFHVCRYCGVVPAAQRKDPREARHRGWCPQRRGHDPDGWADVALMHDLTTEAVRVLVPPVVMADDIQLVSFTAAFRLGLRGLLGGDPTHLDAFRAVEPGPRGRHDLVVLHDTVPGGTGYLARFSDPDEMHQLLKAAESALAGCPCQHEGLACCHRCLLPLVGPDEVALARRDRALEMVRQLLDQWHPRDLAHELRAIDADPAETPIERRFRVLLSRWARQQRAGARTTVGSHGDRLTFTVRAGDHNRTWIVQAQVPLGDVRPDYLLHTDDPSVPDIAVFCDSVRYHASVAHNRTADDAAKRSRLRRKGYRVWAVTHEDLDRFDRSLARSSAERLPFLSLAQHSAFERASQQVDGAGGVRAADVRGDAMTLLVKFLQAAEPQVWRSVARAASMGMLGDAGRGAVVRTSGDLYEIAAAHARQGHLESRKSDASVSVVPTRTAAGATVLLRPVRHPHVEVVLALDDRPESVGGPDHTVQWRDWLAASNLLQFLDDDGKEFEAVTTTQQLGTTVAVVEPPALSSEWRDVVDVAVPSARGLLIELAGRGIPTPEPGRDGPDHLWQIDIAWPEYRIAVLVDDDHPDRIEKLRQDNWSVVRADVDDIVNEIEERRGMSR